ncbi:unnamed protein product [Macrosiphum euphorbiae]|uniref:HAT C-terminal dimerisation domain-containing protein n=2 Tax=Aphidinae TaxID=133076 RepID=A0AAV0WPX1_9HEMI|nr:unnamed protein product [Macrosiphum euphorbiae]
MGKIEKLRKYRKSWENELWAKGWLAPADSTANTVAEAYCKVCRSFLRAHVTDLKRHAKTKIHSDNMVQLNPMKKDQSVLSNIVKISNEQKIIDLKLAVYVSTHTSIMSVDHLGEILKVLGKGTALANLKLHRTKCSSLIQNVIAPTLLEELVQDIGTNYYSLIIDESTDVSVFKYLCLCIKYFSSKTESKIIKYLGIIEVVNCSADSLYDCICNYMQVIGLNLSKLIGIGTDGANNLCGKYHSLFTNLKQKSPNLQIVRCICHSLNNAVSKASESFPSTIDYLCREVYNWFHISPKRRDEYKQMFDLLNSGLNKKFHNFHQISGTRWLARSFVVNTILEHWLELKTHFSLMVKKEKCYASRIIHEMLHDDTNYLYLIIIKPILQELNSLNLTFQKNFVDFGRSYYDICCLFIFLAKKIIKESVVSKGFEYIYNNINNDSVYRHSSNCDYGVGYNQSIININLSQEKKSNVQTQAFNFIKQLLYEIKKRLPDNIEFFKKMKLFSPTLCLCQLHVNFIDLPFVNLFLKPSEIVLIETQWEKLTTVTWKMYLNEKQLNDANLFWPKVYNYKDAGGNFAFRELSEFVLKGLSLPSSNAVVERVFSIMNTVKTKSRNRINANMLDALLRIKTTFISTKTCCTEFVPPKSMYDKFNSEMYNKKNYVNTIINNVESLDNDFNDELINIVNEISLPDFY